MELFLYLLLAVVLYGMLADYIDRAVEREMERRRHRAAHLYLVENHDAGAADALDEPVAQLLVRLRRSGVT